MYVSLDGLRKEQKVIKVKQYEVVINGSSSSQNIRVDFQRICSSNKTLSKVLHKSNVISYVKIHTKYSLNNFILLQPFV